MSAPSCFLVQQGGEAAARRAAPRLRDGQGWPEGPDLAGEARTGPSRLASPETARPARRAGQPQKIKKRSLLGPKPSVLESYRREAKLFLLKTIFCDFILKKLKVKNLSIICSCFSAVIIGLYGPKHCIYCGSAAAPFVRGPQGGIVRKRW